MAWSNAPHRRQLSRGAPKHIRQHVLRRDGNTCQICGDDGSEVDHILNKARGGTDHPDNLQTLCASCHQIKTRHEEQEGKRRQREQAFHPRESHPGIAHSAKVL